MRAIAPSRSGPALSTPPNRWSQTSVVVTSMTPASSPLSASFSMVRPPVPVAWKTRQSSRVAQALDDLRHAGRGDAEHGEPDARASPSASGHRPRAMPTIGVGGVAQHGAADPVEPGDIGDRPAS